MRSPFVKPLHCIFDNLEAISTSSHCLNRKPTIQSIEQMVHK